MWLSLNLGLWAALSAAAHWADLKANRTKIPVPGANVILRNVGVVTVTKIWKDGDISYESIDGDKSYMVPLSIFMENLQESKCLPSSK